MSIRIRKYTVRSATVFELHGDITGQNISKISEELEKEVYSEMSTTALDLSNIAFIDSQGLGVFVYCWKLFQKANKKIILINPQDFVRSMFSETSLDQMFEILNSQDELK